MNTYDSATRIDDFNDDLAILSKYLLCLIAIRSGYEAYSQRQMCEIPSQYQGYVRQSRACTPLEPGVQRNDSQSHYL